MLEPSPLAVAAFPFVVLSQIVHTRCRVIHEYEMSPTTTLTADSPYSVFRCQFFSALPKIVLCGLESHDADGVIGLHLFPRNLRPDVVYLDYDGYVSPTTPIEVCLEIESPVTGSEFHPGVDPFHVRDGV